MPSCVDLHLHSTASDGTDAPTELAVLLQTLGIHTFALTDHDTKEGINQLKSTIQRGVTLIPGIEFSCRMTNPNCKRRHPSRVTPPIFCPAHHLEISSINFFASEEMTPLS